MILARPDRSDVISKFENYCFEHKIRIIRMLQQGSDGADLRSFVFLIQDTDGLFKIAKELINYKVGDWETVMNNEDEIYSHLPPADFFPKFYGVENVSPHRFIRQSFLWGQSLTDYIRPENLLSVDAVCQIIWQITRHLQWFYENGVLYLDLKPSNLRIHNSQVDILDLGLSRIIRPEEIEVEAFVAQPRYGAPEIGLEQKASVKSLVFQLGIIFYELLTGNHPFVHKSNGGSIGLEEEISHYLHPIIHSPYQHQPEKEFGDARLEIISRMLEKEPSIRPELNQVAEKISRTKVMPIRHRPRMVHRERKRNTILFPARMGIPHKGHIEFMTRLLEIGYYLKISLQRCYTLTDRDPIPKWLVAKMVAQSLFDRGFTEEDFEFIYTPFFETALEMKYHFAMMPDRTDIVAVASSNPGIGELFSGFEIWDQRMVFGLEGDEYDDLSWGETIRQAVKGNDREKFDDYAASGVKKILTLDELQTIYAQPMIEFIPGSVRVVCLDQFGHKLASGAIFRYLSPEESIRKMLEEQRHICEILDRYGKTPSIIIDGEKHSLEYKKVEFDGHEETIYFQLV